MNREELMMLDKSEIIDILFKKIEDLTNIIIQQDEKIKELESRLNQNSKNSSKPPSSDGYKKPQSQRKPSDKKVGGQMGHDGSGLKLIGEPDKYVNHDPKKCAACPMADECQKNKTVSETRYELDVNINTSIIAHQITKVNCPLTSEQLRGDFPVNITGWIQYGTNIEALAVSLNTIGMVSINRTHEILNGIFGVPISTGTISSMVSECAGKMVETVNEIKEAIIEEPVVNFDETGTRVDKKTVWAHTASTDSLTYIEIHESRGKKGMNAIGILLMFIGTAIHDCFASYFTYTSVQHGLCNAHLLRELIAVMENTKQVWAQGMIDLLLEMKMIKEKLISQNKFTPSRYYIDKFNLVYDKIITEALEQNPIPVPDVTKKGRPKRGKTGALVDRLILHKEKYLLFFNDFNVPFDNNQAERDIRMFKVKQKVSGCFRTMDGAKEFATIMSFIGTARKRGIPAFKAIKDALLGNPFSLKSVI